MDYQRPPDGAVFPDDEEQSPEAFAADSSRNTVSADRCQVLVVSLLGRDHDAPEAGHLELLSAFLGLPVVPHAPMDAEEEAELIVDEGQACIRFRGEGFPITAYRNKSQVARRVTLAELHAGNDVRLDAGAVLSAMIDILDMIKSAPKKASKRRQRGGHHAQQQRSTKSSNEEVSSMIFLVPAALTEIDEPGVDVYGRSYGGNSVACVSTLGCSVRTMLSTSAHEILHCYQVEHCVTYKCLMNSSPGSGVDEASAPFFLCPHDLAKLETIVRPSAKNNAEPYSRMARHRLLAERFAALGDEFASDAAFQRRLCSLLK